MKERYSDEEIAFMLSEKKFLTKPISKVRFKEDLKYKTAKITANGESGNSYKLIIKQNLVNRLNFSVILAYIPENSNQLFRIKRYNGKSHKHKNHIENNEFYSFHIHSATERYQNRRFREDAYAESTEAFADVSSALQCMISECNLVILSEDQQSLGL